MRTHHDAKAMAKTLRDELKQHKLDLPHGQCLDIVARQFGLKDWNVLAAKLGESENPTSSDDLVIPEGWKIGGNAPHIFDLGLSPKDSTALIIRRKADIEITKREEYATLMQVISAKQHIGRRMVFSAELKAEDVVGSATIWFRVDGADNVLKFANLEKTPTDGSISGNVDWVKRKIVFDIPENAVTIHFGFYLLGFGQALGRNFQFEEETANSEMPEIHFPEVPINLNLASLPAN